MSKARALIDILESYEAKIAPYASVPVSTKAVNGKKYPSTNKPFLYNSKTQDYWVVFSSEYLKDFTGIQVFAQKAGSLDSARKIEKAILNDTLPSDKKGRVIVGFISIVEPSEAQDSGLYKELNAVGSVDIVKELKALYTNHGVYDKD